MNLLKSLDVAKFLISENFITTNQAMANGLIEEELGTNKIMLIKPEDILIKLIWKMVSGRY